MSGPVDVFQLRRRAILGGDAVAIQRRRRAMCEQEAGSDSDEGAEDFHEGIVPAAPRRLKPLSLRVGGYRGAVRCVFFTLRHSLEAGAIAQTQASAMSISVVVEAIRPSS